MTPIRGWRAAWWVLVIALASATVGAATLGAWQMQIKSRQLPPVADQLADREAAVQAARTGTAKVLTYSPDTLEQDFSASAGTSSPTTNSSPVRLSLPTHGRRV